MLNKGILSLISFFILRFAFWGMALAQIDLDGDGIPNSEDPETIVSANDTLEAGEYTFQNLIITNNSVLTLNSVDTLQGFKGVNINAENLTIDQGASISGDGKGYGPDSGPGAGGSGCGGGYGGASGDEAGGSAYGSITAPSNLGSGGGTVDVGYGHIATGGTGGGAIRLTVAGMLTIDGSLTANGNNGGYHCWNWCAFDVCGGGGSGGSIWVLANELTGTGVISANGGDGHVRGPYVVSCGSGGGGGGRIAIYYDASTYTGTFSNHGGTGHEAGGAGTIYLKYTGQTYGPLLVDNNNIAGAVTPINETITFDNLTVQNKARLSVTTGTTITTPTAIVSGADLNIESSAVMDILSLALESSSTLVLASGSNLSLTDLSMSSSTITNNGSLTWTTVAFTGTNEVTNNGQLDVPELIVVNLTFYQEGSLNIADNGLTIDANGVFVLDVPLETGSVTVNSDGILTHSAGEDGFDLTVTGDLTVDAGGAITVNGKGYGPDSGPGAGGSGCGGSYGGAGGGESGVSTYGSITAPSDLGSGGGRNSYYASAAGGAGGGAIRLSVAGMLTVDGSFTANGNDGVHYCTNWCSYHYYGGGGSGGSIYVITGELTGTGVILANGGNSGSGGGGGGRIAIYYNASTYTGSIFAHGGTGPAHGEDGTVVFEGPSFAGLAGIVAADCPAPNTGLAAIVIDLYEQGTGDLVNSALTDVDGTYLIEDITPGNYIVTGIIPLSYDAIEDEVPVILSGGASEIVDFPLTCIVIDPLPPGLIHTLSSAYWKGQVGKLLKGQVRDIDAATLCGYLDLIEGHFNNNVINQVVVYEPPVSGVCMDKLLVAGDLLNTRGDNMEVAQARQQLIALLLNVVSGKISQTAVISEDGATVSQAITFCDNIIDDPDGDYHLARDICKEINKIHEVAADVIDLSIDNIAYKKSVIPLTFSFAQNYPNPFNAQTTIEYSLPEAGHVTVFIYDLLGRKAAVLVDAYEKPGYHLVSWDASEAAAGIYFYKIQVGEYIEAKKMLLLK